MSIFRKIGVAGASSVRNICLASVRPSSVESGLVFSKRGRFLPTTAISSRRSFRSFHASASAETDNVHADVFEDVRKAAKEDLYFQICNSLATRYPDYTLTTAHHSTGLLDFARAGKATAKLDVEGQKLLSWLKHDPANEGSADGEPGKFRDRVCFGRYDYRWKDESFIVYTYCKYWDNDPQSEISYFILRKREGDRIVDGRSSIVKDLVAAASTHTNDVHEGDMLVWDDDSWTKDNKLWKSVQKAKWDNVILDNALKTSLVQDVETFFDQKDHYNRFEVPWKRGILLHGLPGNGKTIAIKALMKGLSSRQPTPIPTLYVKSGKGNYGTIWAIRHIFEKARKTTPCLLVFEDLDSLISDESRSFFLNEVDGLESNEGLMMIGSTNYLEKLDAGITKRPSRFDRKYHFDLPALAERSRYCEFWRQRLASNQTVEFPERMCAAIATITDGFSFAYLQEAFISSLLVIVNQQRQQQKQQHLTDVAAVSDPKALESFLLWRVICKQVETLRNEIKDSRKSAKDAVEYSGPKQASKAGFA